MTNWEKYFGSPEKMAEELSRQGCRRCPLSGKCHTYEGRSCYAVLLEWLNQEAD